MDSCKRFAMTITASPIHSEQHHRALRFAQVIHESKHSLKQIFFYGDGVLCAQPNAQSALDWENFVKQSSCLLYVCVSAAERRGLQSLNSPWQLVGLGDWIEGLQFDHHLHFGE